MTQTELQAVAWVLAFVFIVLTFFMWTLTLVYRRTHPTTDAPLDPEAQLELRVRALCPKCRAFVAEDIRDGLHRRLGGWYVGEYQEPCPQCGEAIKVSIRMVKA